MTTSGGAGSSRKDGGFVFEQQNDVRMNELGSKISALKNITIDIHQDVNAQDRLLNESHGIFDGFGNSLQNSVGRLNRMVSKRHQRQLCFYVTIALVVFFILYYGSGLISWSSSSSEEVNHDGI
ncbi:uncharacterized protein BX664DRAFT_324124 [Halteromyces radiatus]|uniref:uncharacterized protein n=1 Tax=Halteromyces radiatus TaxID=101107 RepID=UPI00221F6463|nr:uncharacterized protein BX664DRAFT_324124 [Halteromyces radiatus]KAI8096491.1 hypothetical protein BX664DRAFT_324124 [Halteromyces radiatus]